MSFNVGTEELHPPTGSLFGVAGLHASSSLLTQVPIIACS
jgi:hypothetical protein